MLDLFYVAVVVVFFVLMVALVHACDRIVGSDEDALGLSGPADVVPDQDSELAA